MRSEPELLAFCQDLSKAFFTAEDIRINPSHTFVENVGSSVDMATIAEARVGLELWWESLTEPHDGSRQRQHQELGSSSKLEHQTKMLEAFFDALLSSRNASEAPIKPNDGRNSSSEEIARPIQICQGFVSISLSIFHLSTEGSDKASRARVAWSQQQQSRIINFFMEELVRNPRSCWELLLPLLTEDETFARCTIDSLVAKNSNDGNIEHRPIQSLISSVEVFARSAAGRPEAISIVLKSLLRMILLEATLKVEDFESSWMALLRACLRNIPSRVLSSLRTTLSEMIRQRTGKGATNDVSTGMTYMLHYYTSLLYSVAQELPCLEFKVGPEDIWLLASILSSAFESSRWNNHQSIQETGWKLIIGLLGLPQECRLADSRIALIEPIITLCLEGCDLTRIIQLVDFWLSQGHTATTALCTHIYLEVFHRGASQIQDQVLRHLLAQIPVYEPLESTMTMIEVLRELCFRYGALLQDHLPIVEDWLCIDSYALHDEHEGPARSASSRQIHELWRFHQVIYCRVSSCFRALAPIFRRYPRFCDRIMIFLQKLAYSGSSSAEQCSVIGSCYMLGIPSQQVTAAETLSFLIRYRQGQALWQSFLESVLCFTAVQIIGQRIQNVSQGTGDNTTQTLTVSSGESQDVAMEHSHFCSPDQSASRTLYQSLICELKRVTHDSELLLQQEHQSNRKKQADLQRDRLQYFQIGSSHLFQFVLHLAAHSGQASELSIMAESAILGYLDLFREPGTLLAVLLNTSDNPSKVHIGSGSLLLWVLELLESVMPFVSALREFLDPSLVPYAPERIVERMNAMFPRLLLCFCVLYLAYDSNGSMPKDADHRESTGLIASQLAGKNVTGFLVLGTVLTSSRTRLSPQLSFVCGVLVRYLRNCAPSGLDDHLIVSFYASVMNFSYKWIDENYTGLGQKALPASTPTPSLSPSIELLEESSEILLSRLEEIVAHESIQGMGKHHPLGSKAFNQVLGVEHSIASIRFAQRECLMGLHTLLSSSVSHQADKIRLLFTKVALGRNQASSDQKDIEDADCGDEHLLLNMLQDWLRKELSMNVKSKIVSEILMILSAELDRLGGDYDDKRLEIVNLMESFMVDEMIHDPLLMRWLIKFLYYCRPPEKALDFAMAVSSYCKYSLKTVGSSDEDVPGNGAGRGVNEFDKELIEWGLELEGSVALNTQSQSNNKKHFEPEDTDEMQHLVRRMGLQSSESVRVAALCASIESISTFFCQQILGTAGRGANPKDVTSLLLRLEEPNRQASLTKLVSCVVGLLVLCSHKSVSDFKSSLVMRKGRKRTRAKVSSRAWISSRKKKESDVVLIPVRVQVILYNMFIRIIYLPCQFCSFFRQEATSLFESSKKLERLADDENDSEELEDETYLRVARNSCVKGAVSSIVSKGHLNTLKRETLQRLVFMVELVLDVAIILQANQSMLRPSNMNVPRVLVQRASHALLQLHVQISGMFKTIDAFRLRIDAEMKVFCPRSTWTAFGKAVESLRSFADQNTQEWKEYEEMESSVNDGLDSDATAYTERFEESENESSSNEPEAKKVGALKRSSWGASGSTARKRKRRRKQRSRNEYIQECLDLEHDSDDDFADLEDFLVPTGIDVMTLEALEARWDVDSAV